MAVRPKIEERTPIQGVEVEYVRGSSSRRLQKRGLNRARMLDVSKTSIELGARETFPSGERVQLTLHVKGVRDYVRVEGVAKKSHRVRVLGQPAYAVLIELKNLTAEQDKKIAWAESQLAPKTATRVVRRETAEAPAEVGEATPETVAEEQGARPARRAPARAAARATVPGPAREVKRPMALLELIDRLDKLEVTNDLVLAVIEAAEAGMDVEVLYPKDSEAEARAAAEEEEEASSEVLPGGGEAHLMNVYRLAGNARLYFSEGGLPVGPAAELIYLSRLKSPEKCFAVELGLDSMSGPAKIDFKRGTILVFSKLDRVEDGDFAFVKDRAGDTFAQVFLEKDDRVRIRPQNAKYPERVVKRRDVRVLCKLVGYYQDVT